MARLWSDKYRSIQKDIFYALERASRYNLGSPERIYWTNKAEEYKKVKEDLIKNNKHLYNGGKSND